MRLLFACIPSHGRFFTIAALARAAAQRGHEVLVASAPGVHDLVSAAGLRAASVGADIEKLRRGVFVEQQPGTSLREDQMASYMFTRVWPEIAVPDLLSVARQWSPHAIVHEEGEFAAAIAATKLDLPSITVSWTGPMRFARQWQSLQDAIAPAWRAHDLTPPPYAGMFTTLYLDQCPRSLQRPIFGPSSTLARMRPMIYDGADTWVGTLPPALASNRTVFVTLGTVAAFNRAPEIIQAIIAALKSEPWQVILAIGAGNNTSHFGTLPDNFHIVEFVPQSLLNARLALVICHGGPGTAVSALSDGIPLLLMPRGGAVQQRVASACETLGVARVLTQGEISAESIRRNVRLLIDEPRYQSAARTIAAEIAGMPATDATLDLIERSIALRGGLRDQEPRRVES